MNLIVAGGGTGGHIFPGVAIAREFERQAKNPRVIFVGTPFGLEKDLVPQAGYSLFLIKIGGLKGKKLINRLRSLVRLPIAFIQAIRVINSFAPDLVVGVGGYAAGPVCLAAWLLRVPMVIQEQNTVPGFTNRILGKFAGRVYLAFEHAARYFDARKVVYSGNPIRADILAVQPPLFTEAEPLSVLIFGGSQGASTLNKGVVGSLPYLKMPKEKIRFIHQTGQADFSWVRDAYHHAGLQADVRPFIEDMAAVYAASNLVIARSGASILEIAVCGRPSILVPFPFAADNHQAINAKVFAAGRASLVVENHEFSGERCAQILNELFADRANLQAMAEAAKKLAKRQAAQEIVADSLKWVQHAG